MLIIGSHVGFNKKEQLVGSVKEALSYNANTFMFYTGAPQNSIRSDIDDNLTKEAMELIDNSDIDYSKVIVHAPYIINLANPDLDKFKFSVEFLKNEVKRCEKLGAKNMVLHPGSHVGFGVEVGINNIVKGLNEVLESVSDVTILLETMAGKGHEIGRNFEEIKKIIDGVENKKCIGVCLDSCHMNDAGYDVTDFDKLLDEFDRVVGLSYVKCIHINDSKNEIGSHKDRHENIGFGTIGFDNMINIIYNERLKSVPKILETPYVGDNAPYKLEIEMIRKKEFDKDLKNKLEK